MARVKVERLDRVEYQFGGNMSNFVPDAGNYVVEAQGYQIRATKRDEKEWPMKDWTMVQHNFRVRIYDALGKSKVQSNGEEPVGKTFFFPVNVLTKRHQAYNDTFVNRDGKQQKKSDIGKAQLAQILAAFGVEIDAGGEYDDEDIPGKKAIWNVWYKDQKNADGTPQLDTQTGEPRRELHVAAAPYEDEDDVAVKAEPKKAKATKAKAAKVEVAAEPKKRGRKPKAKAEAVEAATPVKAKRTRRPKADEVDDYGID